MLLGCDASQLEWRTAAYLSQDETAIAEINEGQDTHSLNEKAFELPSRLIAKIYLFRTIFRGSGWSFANDPSFMHVSADPKFWDGINEKFFKKYHGLNSTHTKWADDVIKGNPIVGPFGRQWQIDMKRDFRGELKIPWTTLSNYPVQGTGADIMMIARISFARRLKEMDVSSKFISTVHDSIVLDIEHEKDIQPVVNLFHQVFDGLPKNFDRLFGLGASDSPYPAWNVPLDCECKVGHCMKERYKTQSDGTRIEVCPAGMIKIKRNDKENN